MSRKIYDKEEEGDERWEWPENDEESDEELDDYDLTQLPGVNATLATRLNRAGYPSLWEVAETDVDDLTKIEGITKKSAEKMIKVARELLEFEDE